LKKDEVEEKAKVSRLARRCHPVRQAHHRLREPQGDRDSIAFAKLTNQSIIDPDLIGMEISPNPSFPKRGIVPPFGKGR